MNGWKKIWDTEEKGLYKDNPYSFVDFKKENLYLLIQKSGPNGWYLYLFEHGSPRTVGWATTKEKALEIAKFMMETDKFPPAHK